MTPTPVVIGLDIGTTAAKIVAFEVLESRPAESVGSETQGRGRRWSAEHEYLLVRPRSGWRVQDPAAVIEVPKG